jgi:hypothetical protein
MVWELQWQCIFMLDCLGNVEFCIYLWLVSILASFFYKYLYNWGYVVSAIDSIN